MSLSDDVVQDLCVARVRGPTTELSRRRDARDMLAGQRRQTSPNDGGPDATDGKCTSPKDATQAPDTFRTRRGSRSASATCWAAVGLPVMVYLDWASHSSMSTKRLGALRAAPVTARAPLRPGKAPGSV